MLFAFQAQVEQLQMMRHSLEGKLQNKRHPSENPQIATRSSNTNDSASEVSGIQALRGCSPHLQCASKKRSVPCSELAVLDSEVKEIPGSKIEGQNTSTKVIENSFQCNGRKRSISSTDSTIMNSMGKENPQKGSDDRCISIKNNKRDSENRNNTQYCKSLPPSACVSSDADPSRHITALSLNKIAHTSSSPAPVKAIHPSIHLIKSTVEFQNSCLLVPPLEAVEGVTPRLNPEVSWKQSETDVTLTLHLLGVQVYRCRVAPQRVTFM